MYPLWWQILKWTGGRVQAGHFYYFTNIHELSKTIEIWPKIGGKSEISANFFWLKIGWNENFIIQMAYGDEKIFYNLFFFVIEKFDFLVEIPPKREVLWFFS